METARVVAIASSRYTTLDYRANALSRLQALYEKSVLTIYCADYSKMGRWHILRSAATLTIQSFLRRQMFLHRHRAAVEMRHLVCAYLLRIALASEVHESNEARHRYQSSTLIQSHIRGATVRYTHAESTRYAVRIQSAFCCHGEIRTYGQWQDAAATVQRWGRGEISRHRVR